MEIKEVLEKLCYYDKRNPYYTDIIDEDDIYYGGIGAEPTQKSCFCDNCFYGRTKMAEYILKLLHYGN